MSNTKEEKIMPDKAISLMIDCIELMSKMTPYFIGLGVGYAMGLKILTTSVSMLIGSIVVYYIKPVAIKFIDSLKNSKLICKFIKRKNLKK